MYTTAARDIALGALAADVTHLGLLTALPDLRAGTVTEAAYAGYARAAVTWAAASSIGGGRERSNNALLSLGGPNTSGSPVDVIAWAGFNASSGGLVRVAGLLDSDPPGFFTAIDPATEDLVAPGHGLEVNQRVFFFANPNAALPAGLAENTAYHVISAGLTANSFRVSATQGGAAVNLTGVGSGWYVPYKAVTISAGGTAQIEANAARLQA